LHLVTATESQTSNSGLTAIIMSLAKSADKTRSDISTMPMIQLQGSAFIGIVVDDSCTIILYLERHHAVSEIAARVSLIF
jgi:hypothetical protein